MISTVKESIKFLLEDHVDYEFRTTVAKGLHTIDDIKVLSEEIKGAKRYFIQNFVDSGNILKSGLAPFDDDVLIDMKNAAKKYIDSAFIRGTDL